MDRKKPDFRIIFVFIIVSIFALIQSSYGRGFKADSITARIIRAGGDSANVKIDSVYGVRLFNGCRNWDDMGEIKLGAARTVGLTGAPALAQTGEGYSLTQWNVNDSLEGEIENYHRFINGDTTHFHMHYLTAVKDGSARYVKWQFHVIIKNVGDSTNYDSTFSAEDTIPANTKALLHRYLELHELATPAMLIGSYIFIVVKRITASNTAPSVNPFGITAGIHKKIDMFGSRNELTK